MQLKELEVNARGRIVFIRPSDGSRIERLASMGIAPGSILKLKKKRPSYVFEIDETTLAVDASIVEEIYVKQI
jgi:Fe2+ transport system protein FeoA